MWRKYSKQKINEYNAFVAQFLTKCQLQLSVDQKINKYETISSVGKGKHRTCTTIIFNELQSKNMTICSCWFV